MYLCGLIACVLHFALSKLFYPLVQLKFKNGGLNYDIKPFTVTMNFQWTVTLFHFKTLQNLNGEKSNVFVFSYLHLT